MAAEVLTHFDEHGAARMVDVAAKAATHRIARARGRIVMRAETLQIMGSAAHAVTDRGAFLR